MNFPAASCGVSLRSVAQATPRDFALQRRDATLPLGGAAPSDPRKADAIHPPSKLGRVFWHIFINVSPWSAKMSERDQFKYQQIRILTNCVRIRLPGCWEVVKGDLLLGRGGFRPQKNAGESNEGRSLIGPAKLPCFLLKLNILRAHGRDKEDVYSSPLKGFSVIMMEIVQADTNTYASQGGIQTVDSLCSRDLFIPSLFRSIEQRLELGMFLDIHPVERIRLPLFLAPEDISSVVENRRKIVDGPFLLLHVKASCHYHDQPISPGRDPLAVVLIEPLFKGFQ